MINPISTYRLQFHKDFTFTDFERIIPYLEKLGVGTIYASPIFEATAGSAHGYDGLNPHKINPEIGTEEQLLQISNRLHEKGIKWVQDIVPNHMAFDANNPWLKDVLEKGQRSMYASFFDVPWTGKIYHGKIMIPFLGSPLSEVIENNELKVDFEDPSFVLKYFDSTYPLRLRSYLTILDAGIGEPNQAVQQLLDQVKAIQKSEDPETYKQSFHEFQLQLTALFKNEKTREYLESCLQEVNDDPDQVRKIADEQVYQLVNWQKTDQKINFRRFFTVNGLICLNMQDTQVFQYYHEYIKELMDKGVFQGLRIDHIDGLFDPTRYLDQLRQLAGNETYIVVEKILEPGEKLPDNWPIEGTTGYEFLADANNIFTNQNTKQIFTSFYNKLVNENRTIEQQIQDKKAQILSEHMGGELYNLFQLFLDLNIAEAHDLEALGSDTLKEAIAEFLIQCPVYRYYGNKLPLTETEAECIRIILQKTSERKPHLALAVELLNSAILKRPTDGDTEYNPRALRFYQRCMQFTGPLMAKGVEDTLMYTNNRFIGHNEVGDSPEAFGDSIEVFHEKMADRLKNWPLCMNGTSTHDTKRGEDVRARLNVLTDLPDEWFTMVTEWQKINADLKENNAPDANDEYLIYQTLVGAYPMPDQGEDNFDLRIQDYLQKALREAKTHSNWTTPDENYEAATKNFALKLLDKSSIFWQSFASFHRKLADFGIINSLAQVLIKFTAPGVPDVYQGTELWDFSLVDPDNRRPVDYELREKFMNELEAKANEDGQILISQLWRERYSAKIKLWLVHTLLNDRKNNSSFFETAEYTPLQVTGEYKLNVLAYARRWQNQWYIVAIPLHLAAMCHQQEEEEFSVDWKDTSIVLPAESPSQFKHLFTFTDSEHLHEIKVREIFKSLPMAVLKSK